MIGTSCAQSRWSCFHSATRRAGSTVGLRALVLADVDRPIAPERVEDVALRVGVPDPRERERLERRAPAELLEQGAPLELLDLQRDAGLGELALHHLRRGDVVRAVGRGL